MRKTLMEKIRYGNELPLELFEKHLKDNVMYPIVKTSEKTIFDKKTGEEKTTTKFVCSKCGETYRMNERVYSLNECTKCGNKSYFSLNGIYEGIKTSQFSGETCTEINTFENIPDNSQKTYLLIRASENEKQDLEDNAFIYLNKRVVDDETYFILKQYQLNFGIDAEKGKTLILTENENEIIISKKEIVVLKCNEPTRANINGFFCCSSFYHLQHIIGQEDIMNEFIELTKQFVLNDNIVQKITDRRTQKEQFVLNINTLWSYIHCTRSSRKTVKENKNKDAINEIINKLPKIEEIELDHGDTYYETLEIDNLKNTAKVKYQCRNCGKENIKKITNYSYTKDTAEHICENCGATIDNIEKKMIDRRDYEETIGYIDVIQDYEDGVVLRDYKFEKNIIGNKVRYIPIKNYEPSNIIIFKKDFNENKFMSNVILYKKDFQTGTYVQTKSWRSMNKTGTVYTYNGATNLNINWSAVELFDKTFYGCYNVPDTIFKAKYLLAYRKYPVLEKILKQDYLDIARHIIVSMEWATGEMPVTYDLQKNDVAGAFRISKVFLKMLNESTHRTELLPSLQALYNVDENMSFEDFEFITNNRISCYKLADICKNFDLTIHQACQYLERVRIAQCVNPNTATSEWADYLKASKLIGCDLSDRRVKYPAALRTEHDKVMYKKKIIENENYEENFKKITEEYGEKYSYKTKNFIVTYPKKLEDLFEEGRELNHCVGSYGDSIRDGSSVILFIRKADEPDKPYYTMEVNPLHNAVTQLHGYSNKNINKSKNVKLHEFIKEWANRNKIIYQ